MGNILENTVECTCEEFVAEIAGKRRKPYLDALKSTFKTIVLGKSTLVKEMSSFLRETEDEGAPAAGPADARPADCGRKRVPPVAGDEVGAGEDGRANGCGEHCDGGWKVRPSGQARNPA